MNEELEAKEQSKKDELKQRRQAACHEHTQSGWRCSEHGCQFVGRSKAAMPCEPRQTEAQQSCADPTKVLTLWKVVSEARFYYAREVL